MSLWCHDRLMRGRKDVVWILVGAIVGTVSLAQGQTQVVPVIVASEPYNSDVMNRADRHGLLRKDDVTNTSLRVRKPGKSQVEPQCGSGGRGAIAETSVDSPKAICMRVAESASLDLDQAMRWIGRRTTLQGTEQGADALWFSPEPFGILPGTANSAIGSDYGVSAGTRTAINMDWIPGFNAQPVTPTPPPTPGGVPGPGVLGEAPPEPIRQLVPVWRVVPLLSVSERYDSNVFFAPKSSLVGLNAKPEDFVTTVNPQLAVVHSGRLMQGMLLGGTTSEVYIQNPDLNYTGYNGQVSMELAQAVQRMLPRARSLVVSDSLLYTPQLPAFFQGGPNFIGIGVPSQTSNIFGTGIQAFRINTFSNQGSVQGSYGLSPTTDFGVGYTHRSEEHTSELQSPYDLVCRLLLEKKKQLKQHAAAVLLLPFDQKPEVDGRAVAAGLDRLEETEHLPLVVGGAAGEQLAIAHRRLDRRRGPLVQRVGRLDVIMPVDEQRRC